MPSVLPGPSATADFAECPDLALGKPCLCRVLDRSTRQSHEHLAVAAPTHVRTHTDSTHTPRPRRRTRAAFPPRPEGRTRPRDDASEAAPDDDAASTSSPRKPHGLPTPAPGRPRTPAPRPSSGVPRARLVPDAVYQPRHRLRTSGATSATSPPLEAVPVARLAAPDAGSPPRQRRPRARLVPGALFCRYTDSYTIALQVTANLIKEIKRKRGRLIMQCKYS